MKTAYKRIFYSLLGLLWLVLPGHIALAQSPTDVESALAANPTARVIVVLHPVEAGAAQAGQIARSQESVIQAVAPHDFSVIQTYQTLPGLVGEVTSAGLDALRQQPEVAAIALDLPVEIADVTPNASLIGADAVWQDFGLNGAGVRVAVLDTGVDTAHVDLSPSLVAQHCFNRNGGCLPDSNAESDSAQDQNGHGTHVAGIIAGRGQTSPQGMAPRRRNGGGAGVRAKRVRFYLGCAGRVGLGCRQPASIECKGDQSEPGRRQLRRGL
ncbi:MAG: S8 family serine peptidase [Anaerolineales bacterium]|nr:S8 family serine peptidase [Anaerolineales bacterium]